MRSRTCLNLAHVKVRIDRLSAEQNQRLIDRNYNNKIRFEHGVTNLGHHDPSFQYPADRIFDR